MLCVIYTHTYVMLIHIHTYNRILLSHKKNEIIPLAATRMDLKGIMLSEINSTEKDKYSELSLTCGI